MFIYIYVYIYLYNKFFFSNLVYFILGMPIYYSAKNGACKYRPRKY